MNARRLARSWLSSRFRMVIQASDPLESLPKLREFLDAIAPMLPAYRFGVLSFVSVLHNGENVILRGRLDLRASAGGSLKPPISTVNLTAAQIPLRLDSAGIEACIRSAATGSWLPLAGWHLLKLAPRVPLAYFLGFDARYERMDSMAVEKLVISGMNRHQLLNPRATEIEGEVSKLGLDSLEKLLRIYGLHGSDAQHWKSVLVGWRTYFQSPSLTDSMRVFALRWRRGY